MPEVAPVYSMAGDTDQREADGETVDESEEDLNGDDKVDEAGEKFTGQNGVLFDQFRKIVESTGFAGLPVSASGAGTLKAGVERTNCKSEEAEAQDDPKVANKW